MLWLYSLSLLSYIHPENVTLVASMKSVAAAATIAAAFVSDVHGEQKLGLSLYERAASFVSTIDDGQSEVHAIALSGCGRLQSATGNHARALELVTQAREICTELFGENSDRYVRGGGIG